MGYVTVIVCIVIIVLVVCKELTTKEPEPIVTFSFDVPKNNKKKSVRAQPDPIKQSAKNILVSFGYTATEAKKMLQPLNCGTIDQYVNEAMKKVKI